MHTNDINADNKDQVKCMDLEREDVYSKLCLPSNESWSDIEQLYRMSLSSG